MGLEAKNIVRNHEGNVVSKTYSCPKKWIKIKKPIKRILTDEQKEALRERMKTLQGNTN